MQTWSVTIIHLLFYSVTKPHARIFYVEFVWHNHTSRYIAMFVLVDVKIIAYTMYGMFMTYIHINFQMPSSLPVVIKPRAKDNFVLVAALI
jgi:hypothetical protein